MRINDVSAPGSGPRAKQYLPFFQRSGAVPCIVEFVMSGSRVRLLVPKVPYWLSLLEFWCRNCWSSRHKFQVSRDTSNIESQYDIYLAPTAVLTVGTCIMNNSRFSGSILYY